MILKKSKTYPLFRLVVSSHTLALTLFILLGGLLFFGPSPAVSAAPPQCFNHDGSQSRACQNVGVQLLDDKCYTEYRGGPSGTLMGYNETSCNDPTDRDQDGNAGGAGASQGTSQPTYTPNDCNEQPVNKNNCGIVRYIVIFIQLLSGIASVVIVASIIYGGIQYSMAGSDPQKTASAKDRIRNAIIALVFFIFGFALLNFLVPGGVL